jgi:hypothetical protein
LPEEKLRIVSESMGAAARIVEQPIVHSGGGWRAMANSSCKTKPRHLCQRKLRLSM